MAFFRNPEINSQQLTVKDQKSGTPIEGVVVYSGQFHNTNQPPWADFTRSVSGKRTFKILSSLLSAFFGLEGRIWKKFHLLSL